jgi:methylmalonyl-CoA mutase
MVIVCQPPRVVLLPMGDPAMRSARANYARNVFGVAGFAVDDHLGFDSSDTAAQAAEDAEANIAVICSADDAYSTLVPDIYDALDARNVDPIVVVAGAVPDQRETLKEAGADVFIHRGMPLLDVLEDFQRRLGIM